MMSKSRGQSRNELQAATLCEELWPVDTSEDQCRDQLRILVFYFRLFFHS